MKEAGSSRFWGRLLREDSAQATVEYIVLLAVVTGMVILAGKALKPILKKLMDSSTGFIDRLFSSGNLHRSPFR